MGEDDIQGNGSHESFTNSQRQPKMVNLDVFHFLLLEITAVSRSKELSEVVFSVFWWVLLIHKLLQWFHHHMVSWKEEEWKRKPFFLSIHHHPVLHTFIFVIAPNLHTQP